MIKRIKYGAFALLFIMTMTLSSIVAIIASNNAGIGNDFYLTYAPPGPVTLMTGPEMSKRIKNGTDYAADNNTITKVVFDYRSSVNESIIENASRCVSVASNGSDDALLYQVGTEIYILAVSQIIAPQDLSYLFNNMRALTSVSFANFDASASDDFHFMFQGCTSITTIDVSKLNQENKSVRIDAMFAACSSLRTIYASTSWDYAWHDYSPPIMFAESPNIVGQNGTVYQGAMSDDYVYAKIDAPGTPGYFTYKSADSAFLTSGENLNMLLKNTTSSSNTYDDNNITKVVFDYNTEENLNKVKNATRCVSASMYGTSEILMYQVGTEIYILSSSKIQATDLAYTCTKMKVLTSVEFVNLDTSMTTDMNHMFNECSRLQTLDLSTFDTAKVTNMDFMFASCTNLTTIYVSGLWSTASVYPFDDGTYCEYGFKMFGGCENIVGGNGTRYTGDTNLLDNCVNMAIIDEPGTPGYLTYKGSTVTLLSGEDFNQILHKVTDQSYRGEQVEPTTKIVFDYKNSETAWIVQGAEYSHSVASDSSDKAMLYQIGSTIYILSESQILAPGDMSYYFDGMAYLTSIEFNNFNAKNATGFDFAFQNCSSLTTLDLSKFNPGNNMVFTNGMFIGCSALKTIYVSTSWNGATYDNVPMFAYCESLVGGNGTTFMGSAIGDEIYAVIDTPSTPGYFTQKP